MSLVNDVKALLKSGNIPGIDNIYTVMIPEAVQKTVKTTDVLITDVTDVYQGYGSNRSTEKRSTVALNIFYSKTNKVDDDATESTIVNLFESAGWTCVYSPGHSIDPDTKQLSKVMQFATDIERKVE